METLQFEPEDVYWWKDGNAGPDCRNSGNQKWKKKKLTMVMVEGEGPNMLGRSWLKDLGLLPEVVNQVTAVPALRFADVLDRHTDVF